MSYADFQLYHLAFMLVTFFAYGFWRSWQSNKIEASARDRQAEELFRLMDLPLMEENQFWRIIQSNKCESLEEQEWKTANALVNLAAMEVAAFDKRFRFYQNELFTTNLCAAIRFFDSEASFETVSSCIIAHGRLAYENILREPEVIVDVPSCVNCRQGFAHGASRVYGQKTGNILQEPVWRLENSSAATPQEYLSSLRYMEQVPRGNPVDAAEFPKLFPRIADFISQRSQASERGKAS
jgi:hypothetical protein